MPTSSVISSTVLGSRFFGRSRLGSASAAAESGADRFADAVGAASYAARTYEGAEFQVGLGLKFGPSWNGSERRGGRARGWRLWLCGLLAAAGALGAAAIPLRSVDRYVAVAEASLPYASAGGASLPSLGTGKAGPDAGIVISREPALDGNPSDAPYEFRATASRPADAVARVNAAALDAVERDTAAWARAASRQPGMAALPLAHVVSNGEDNGLETRTRMRYDSGRLPLAGGWLAAFCAAALLVARTTPKRRASDRERERDLLLRYSSKSLEPSTGSAAPEASRLEDLPRLASVELARDVSGTGEPEFGSSRRGRGIRPILSNTSEKLWINFASRTDLATARAAAEAASAAERADGGLVESLAADAAQAVARQVEASLPLGPNTEILFTRLTPDARGSRAALLAVARLLAQRGKRVTLVDLDFAGSSETKSELGLPTEYSGAAEILTGRAELDDCLLTEDEYTALTGLAASSDGSEFSPGQAARLLQSPELLDLLDTLRLDNDLVLIHGPIASEAAKALGPRVDAALLVVGQELTDGEARAGREALARMNAARANLIGRIEFIGDAE